MRRALLLCALTTLPLPLWADDFYAAAPVISAILYPNGTTQTHQIKIDLPAGQHRILLPATSFVEGGRLPELRITNGNATLGPVTIQQDMPSSDPNLLTTAQAQAKTKVEAAEDNVKAQQTVISQIADSIASLKNELAFLESIAAPDTATSVEELQAMASLVGNGTQDVRVRMAAKQSELQDAKERLKTQKKELLAAQNAYDRLSPPAEIGPLVAMSVSLPKAQNLILEASTNHWDGGWAPFYDLRLSEPAQDSVEIRRKLGVRLPEGAVWDQIDLTLSTQRPSDQVAPSEPQANQASIYEPQPVPTAAPRNLKSADMAAMAPMPELMTLREEQAGMAVVDTSGVAITYHYPGKVSAAGRDEQVLELGSLTLPVTPEIYAVPRRDATAFLVAQLTNDSKEPLLGGAAQVYRGDTLIGHVSLPFLAAGDDTTLPFGPIDGIRLEHVVADNETGDSGIITTSNTREQDILWRVTNLTGEAQEVKAFYPLTYSEQEDLEVKVTATPRPDETDHDDKRGLSVWNLSLAPGEKAEVSINTTFRWPEDWQLSWRP